MRQNSNLKRGFTLLEMLYWTTCGSFSTYMLSFMTDTRHVSATVAGRLMALYMACACIGQFVVGGICDRFQNNRKVFVAGMALSIAIQFGIFFSPNLVMLGLFYAMLGLVQPALSSVVDTWLIRSFPDDPNAYSPIRALGSLSYAVTMVVMGYSIEGIGHAAMPIYSTILAIGGIAVALTMPEIPTLPAVQSVKAKTNFRSLPVIVWMFIITMGILGIGTIPLLNMNLLILESVGGTVANMGVATAFNTVAEFLVMRFPKPLLRFNARQRLVGAGLLYVGSSLLMIVSGNVAMLYLVYFLNGMGYGIILPARRQFVTETAPENMHNRIHSMGDMAYVNVGGLVGNQVSGLLIDNQGIRFMMSVSVSIQVIALGLLLSFKKVIAGTKSKAA